MSKPFSDYVKKIAKLRRDKDAPHKPILLIAVLELIDRGQIQHNQIYLSPELVAAFLKYWGSLVKNPKYHSDISLPFFHLKGDNFWHLMANPGFEATIARKVKIRGLTALREVVKYAYLDKELFEYLQEPANRLRFSEVLIQTYFPKEAQQFEGIQGRDELEDIQLRLFEKGGAVYDTSDLKDEERAYVRDTAFRRNVVRLYQHQCALCRLKIVSSNNQTIVDGAHIKPFAEFRDDRFDNGLSLCKNHHWAFDRGWFSIDDNYRVIVCSDRFEEESPPGLRSLKDFHQEPILLPEQHQPRVEALQWHRSFWKVS
ncbi:HNH endonuclease [Thermoleptolyngbya sp. C42_A2020_037]|uniref:HNH endonuclease n=1 Tax=Thermoleptolyngbya sp. C42_A2020_037 TaxID=2747799 RepID=UPI0019ED076F|nr:HNH endonuclease [Thermoleptolyngbya sp. C42_A2020_037]MBF2086289.1 HNH endonuclease [Thermoleptolyngbya sp. C42_A2020_037]